MNLFRNRVQLVLSGGLFTTPKFGPSDHQPTRLRPGRLGALYSGSGEPEPLLFRAFRRWVASFLFFGANRKMERVSRGVELGRRALYCMLLFIDFTNHIDLESRRALFWRISSRDHYFGTLPICGNPAPYGIGLHRNKQHRSFCMPQTKWSCRKDEDIAGLHNRSLGALH